MQFGAFVPQGWRLDLGEVPAESQWDTMVGIARQAEQVGFRSVWVYDHFHTYPWITQQPTWEAWTVMAGFAQATSTVRLGQMCTCNVFRPPALLAKITANVDRMSGGRLDVGIGAGWYEHEYDGYGYEFPKPSIRIGMLDEAVQIMKAMWTQDVTYFDGRYYQLQGAINQPPPVQKPHPPLWIAGGGEQLTLRVVAKYADYANYSGSDDVVRHKTRVLEGHCRDVGRDFDDITLSRMAFVLIGEDKAAVAEKLGEWERRLPADETRDEWRDEIIAGTPDQVAEYVEASRALGYGYLVVYFNDAGWGDGMQLFGEQVIPQFT